MVCEHLSALEGELQGRGIPETFRGQAWSEGCREWVYFDCYLDVESIRARLQMPDFVQYQSNEDPRSGLEEGLYCSRCQDAIMGLHRQHPLSIPKAWVS